MELVPEDDEQIVVIGQTGTGKSNFLKMIIVPYIRKRQIVVIDAKHDDVWDNTGLVVSTPDKLYKEAEKFETNPVLIYRPSGVLASDYEAYDDIYQWVYDRWYTVIATDETTKVTEALKLRQGLDDITTRGRKRHILRAFGIQRPTGCARVVFSEAQRFYIKNVIDRRDRETVSAFAGEYAKLPIETRFGMRYINIKNGDRRYFPEVPLL